MTIATLRTSLADRYRIERELGQGGMATVYLAHDLKHDRQVAIKVMAPELAASIGPDRFLREIRTTANLRHPHIVPLFDSGSVGQGDGGTASLYFVMPYIAGESLQDRLDRDGPCSIEETLRLAGEVAGALGYAHAQGVIHRDIKPGNIMLESGHAVVTDFGIASAVTVAEGNKLTQTGMIVGSPAYMSPEQASAEHPVDGRSDLYSLACVVYEMLTGEPPFTAPTAMLVLARHMFDPVPSLAAARAEVPAPVAMAVERALAKDPAERFDTLEQWREALVSVGASSPGPSGTASPVAATRGNEGLGVVVLPFVNRSPDPDNEYFSDGLTEEVIADLGRIRALRVISRNSAMQLKGTTKDPATLARELGVSHIVSGSVRRAGEALRVTAELLEAAGDQVVWSAKYAGTLDDVFGIQEEIAQKIVAALRMTLTEDEARQVAARPIEDPVAYDCYLRARRHIYEWTPSASPRALRMVDDARALVGDTPLLLATKAQLLWNEINTGHAKPDAVIPQSTELVARALQMDPGHALAISVRGLLAGIRGRPEEALPDLYRAHELSPGDSNILTELCRYSNTAGLRNHGPLVALNARLDPLSAISHLVVSSHHWVNGRFAELVEPVRRTLALAPPVSILPLVVAMQLAAAEHREEASEVVAPMAEAFKGTPLGAGALFLLSALKGDAEGAAPHAPLMGGIVQNEFAAMYVGQAFAMVERWDEALFWRRKAVSLGFINHPFMARHDPFLGALRTQSAYQELLDEVKPRWEAVVAWEAARLSSRSA